MTAELTNEEVVTKLLLSNTFIKPINKSFSTSKNNENFDKFVKAQNSELKAVKPMSKYSFIDQSLNWGF